MAEPRSCREIKNPHDRMDCIEDVIKELNHATDDAILELSKKIVVLEKKLAVLEMLSGNTLKTGDLVTISINDRQQRVVNQCLSA
jgi:hypothetical protein